MEGEGAVTIQTDTWAGGETMHLDEVVGEEADTMRGEEVGCHRANGGEAKHRLSASLAGTGEVTGMDEDGVVDGGKRPLPLGMFFKMCRPIFWFSSPMIVLTV